MYQTAIRFDKMGFKKRKNARKGKQPTQRPDRRNEPYPELIRHNDAFNRYYKHANICTEAEFEDFLAVLRDPLPTTFRITGYKAEAQRLQDLIKNELFNTYATEEDAAVKKPFCLPWYPNEMGWQLELSRKDIRRSEKYYKLHNFLIAETDAGSISRQEAVSMIPPLVLDVQSHHKVLGECGIYSCIYPYCEITSNGRKINHECCKRIIVVSANISRYVRCTRLKNGAAHRSLARRRERDHSDGLRCGQRCGQHPLLYAGASGEALEFAQLRGDQP